MQKHWHEAFLPASVYSPVFFAHGQITMVTFGTTSKELFALDSELAELARSES